MTKNDIKVSPNRAIGSHGNQVRKRDSTKRQAGEEGEGLKNTMTYQLTEDARNKIGKREKERVEKKLF